MSRIGKQPVPVPAGVKVAIEGQSVTVEGPKGKMTQSFHENMAIVLDDNEIKVTRPDDSRQNKALHGLTRSLINNMVVGVTEGYSITLEIHGTGYRADMQGQNLEMHLGFSHPVLIEPPEGIKLEANPRASTVTVSGYDKQAVGQLAAIIRGWRPVEPYLGKGVRYLGEVVRRKAGKAGQAK